MTTFAFSILNLCFHLIPIGVISQFLICVFFFLRQYFSTISPIHITSPLADDTVASCLVDLSVLTMKLYFHMSVCIYVCYNATFNSICAIVSPPHSILG